MKYCTKLEKEKKKNRREAITLSDISSSSSRILTVKMISIISHYNTNPWSLDRSCMRVDHHSRARARARARARVKIRLLCPKVECGIERERGRKRKRKEARERERYLSLSPSLASRYTRVDDFALRPSHYHREFRRTVCSRFFPSLAYHSLSRVGKVSPRTAR